MSVISWLIRVRNLCKRLCGKAKDTDRGGWQVLSPLGGGDTIKRGFVENSLQDDCVLYFQIIKAK